MSGEVAYLELDLAPVLAAARPVVYRPASRYPAARRDLAVVVAEEVTWQQLHDEAAHGGLAEVGAEESCARTRIAWGEAQCDFQNVTGTGQQVFARPWRLFKSNHVVKFCRFRVRLSRCFGRDRPDGRQRI